eukprot:CAMPEP_0170141298 /NCGR_PEP_ID=MMETSP0033_2-20121228/6905_1 /TAXON_ID=195969 /ORGANISM="Dolichomastix tenuilepis, Strain CCMP3274" /LENGTH=649 /DNA_ID=CAMNT_0010377555 /DNA_START=6 /DNA_END=1955 /DNA_ORIENTATION=-
MSLTSPSGTPWSVEIAPGKPASGDTPACTPEYRYFRCKDGDLPQPAATLYESVQSSVVKYKDRPCLGKRQPGAPYVYETYGQVATKVTNLASQYVALGLQKNGRVGCFGANSPEWMIAMQACSAQSLYCVPLYDTLGEDAIEYIVNHAEVSVVCTEASKLKKVASVMPKCTAVKAVIYWGEASASDLEGFKVPVMSFDEALEAGAKKPAEANPPSPEDLCTIMYTSGTTGEPKGVMLTHASILAALAGTIGYLKDLNINLDENDVVLSYLPLAHIFDRVVEEMFLHLGASIAYWQGDSKLLVDDIGASRPTLFVGVPRIFDRIYTAVMDSATGFKKMLFDWAFARKLKRLNAGYAYNKAAPFMDSLVFKKVKAKLGGRVKIIVSGAAPLAGHVEDFLRVCMCCPMAQGYGLTETSAASFVNIPDCSSVIGRVGPPLAPTVLKLESVPDMKYDATADPPRGEVLLKGPGLFKGYYKKPDMTAEVIDKDGWFHTGDIGEMGLGNTLKIIDRKKNIFKLSQGEYVAVEKVENAYGLSPVLDGIWVYGDSFQTFLIGVAVPKEKVLMAFAKENGIAGDFATVCKDPKAVKYILDALGETGNEAKLKGFEKVKKIVLEPVPFDVERDLVTPTFKKKRPQLKEYYKADIDAMYAA